eukprot:7934043-Lingulodinium_polyedra.AAC.1
MVNGLLPNQRHLVGAGIAPRAPAMPIICNARKGIQVVIERGAIRHRDVFVLGNAEDRGSASSKQ